MTITGTSSNDEKFEKLQKERWKKVHSKTNLFHCEEHDNYFNPEEEPCWRCCDECQGDDSSCKFYPLPGDDCVCRAGSDISGLFVCTKEYSKQCQWANEKREEVIKDERNRS